MTAREPDVVLLPVVAEEQPQLLLQAWSEGRHAARWRYATANPYPPGPMAEAWTQGWQAWEAGK